MPIIISQWNRDRVRSGRGSPHDPVILLIMGLRNANDCLAGRVLRRPRRPWVKIVRFDNGDVGLSSKFEDARGGGGGGGA